MKLLSVFGIGEKQILALERSTEAVVTGVGRSYLYVIKKPVRLYPNDSNTRYSHYIFFRYRVNGKDYTGKRFIPANHRCPQKGEVFSLYYHPEKPERYACFSFGPWETPKGW